MERSTARRFVVGDRSGGAGTGVIGWRDLRLTLPRNMSPNVLDARVFYPAVPRLARIDGRRVVRGGGEGAPAAATFGGRAVVVLVHGLAPRYIGARGVPVPRYDSDAVCGGEELDEDGHIHLYRRWESYQRNLALGGYVSLAIDMSFRDERYDDEPDHVLAGVRAFLDDPEWSPLLDFENIGAVGHSTGSVEVDGVADELDVKAMAVFGPQRIGLGNRPNLVIGDEEDINVDSTIVFRSAESRADQHLILFRSYAHYAFFDGVCDEIPRESAAVQRNTSVLALRRFFDRYLRGLEVPEDLGIQTGPPVGSNWVRLVCPGGEGCNGGE